MDETILVLFPCGHIRQVKADDTNLEFEPDGVRIVSESVYYCHVCYRQKPKEFTWLEPREMFIYQDKEFELCRPKKVSNSSTPPQVS